MTKIIKAKTKMEHILSNSKCKFDSAECNSNQKWNNDIFWWKCKKYSVCKKDYSLNLSTCTREIGAYFESIVNDSVITCGKIINVTDTVLISSDYKKVSYEMSCYILYTFLLVTTLLLIIAIICYYYIKYRSKQKKD